VDYLLETIKNIRNSSATFWGQCFCMISTKGARASSCC
jgi:hypothetical protein